jgi:O-antigen/teichoic acid export membrane protein
MNTKKTLLLNGLILTVTSIFLGALGTFSNIYLSKKVGTEAIGMFYIVLSVYVFFVTLATSRNNACNHASYFRRAIKKSH